MKAINKTKTTKKHSKLHRWMVPAVLAALVAVGSPAVSQAEAPTQNAPNYSTDLSNLFKIGWKRILCRIPKDADLVMLFFQTSTIDAYSIKTYVGGAARLIPGKDWTTKGYWISNAYAKKLTKLFYKNVYDLSEYKDKWLVADYFLFLFGNCYKLPILNVSDKFSSVIGHNNNFNIFNTLINGLVGKLFE